MTRTHKIRFENIPWNKPYLEIENEYAPCTSGVELYMKVDDGRAYGFGSKSQVSIHPNLEMIIQYVGIEVFIKEWY